MKRGSKYAKPSATFQELSGEPSSTMIACQDAALGHEAVERRAASARFGKRG